VLVATDYTAVTPLAHGVVRDWRAGWARSRHGDRLGGLPADRECLAGYLSDQYQRPLTRTCSARESLGSGHVNLRGRIKSDTEGITDSRVACRTNNWGGSWTQRRVGARALTRARDELREAYRQQRGALAARPLRGARVVARGLAGRTLSVSAVLRALCGRGTRGPTIWMGDPTDHWRSFAYAGAPTEVAACLIDLA